MEHKPKIKGLIERKLDDPQYRKRFEEGYDAFQLEVQILNAMEKKDWSYSDLAKAVGTSKSNISRDLKGGGLVTATFSRIRKMAEALEMKLIAVLIPKEQEPFLLPRIEDLVRESMTASTGGVKITPTTLPMALLQASPCPEEAKSGREFIPHDQAPFWMSGIRPSAA
jgi:transcriptional regulator with XRE-family HTH domain